MNVIDLIGAANKLANLADQPAIEVDAKRCVHTKNKASNCQICVNDCPVGAIALKDHQVAVEEALCAQCGYCLHSCPTGVFTGVDGVEKLLDCLKGLPRGRVIEIACPHHPQEDTRLADAQNKTVATRCLAAFGVSTYAALMASGVKKVILRLDACAQCPIGQVQYSIIQIAEQANALLARNEIVIFPITRVTDADLRAHPAQHSANKPMSRRELFQIFRKPLEKTSLEPINESNSVAPVELTFDERVPQERVRLLRALRQLGNTTGHGAYTPFVGLNAGKDCTACGVCTFACPTGALQIARGDKQFALNFASGACTDCSLCMQLCPVKTLVFDEPVSVEQAVTLEPKLIVSGPLQRCRRCNAPFASAAPTELCPLCEYRRHFPFGRSMKAQENHG